MKNFKKFCLDTSPIAHPGEHGLQLASNRLYEARARVEICRNYLEAKGASLDDFPNQRADSASPRHEDLH